MVRAAADRRTMWSIIVCVLIVAATCLVLALGPRSGRSRTLPCVSKAASAGYSLEGAAKDLRSLLCALCSFSCMHLLNLLWQWSQQQRTTQREAGAELHVVPRSRELCDAEFSADASAELPRSTCVP